MQSKVINCPKCGRQYHPAEIFVPKYFFGSVENVIRNDNEEITDIIGSDMDTTETFTCDKCNTDFKIETKISFVTNIENNIDFDTDYEHTI